MPFSVREAYMPKDFLDEAFRFDVPVEHGPWVVTITFDLDAHRRFEPVKITFELQQSAQSSTRFDAQTLRGLPIGRLLGEGRVKLVSLLEADAAASQRRALSAHPDDPTEWADEA